MRLIDWLRPLDTYNLYCNIWLKFKLHDGTVDHDLIYAGEMNDIPYWIADYELDDTVDGEPIEYIKYLHKNVDDDTWTEGCTGFCIYIKED